MTKRLLCVVMAMLFVVCSVPFAQAAKTSKSVYKPTNALSYAKGHWNDGKGLCAEFVSDCLKAGGVDDVYERRVINLYNALKDKGWGTAYKLTLTGGTSGRIGMKANEGKLKAGDPVFYYCNVCKQFEHVVLCNGADSEGYMKDYAHNNPHDGNRTTYTYRHCGTNNWTMYSIRMDESETLYGAVTSVTAPKVKEATNLENSVTIKWNAISGATGYRVYRSLPKGSWVYLETVTGTSYTDTKVENGKTYLYTVRACKKNVWSAYYGGYEVTFISPVKFKSSAIADNSIKLTWNTNSSADGYYIYRQKNNGEWVRYADLNKAATSSFVDKDVETGNVYTYQIRVFKGDNMSAYSSVIKQTFLGTPKMTSIVNDLKGITIKWEKLNGSTEYRIYRRGAGEKYWTYLKTVKGDSFTDENVKSGAYYRYTVRSASGNMFGGFDANGLVIRCIATPKLLTAVSANKKVNVLWTPVSGATGYYVYHKLVGAKYWTRIAAVKGTVYSDADVKVGSTYEYTIKAYYGSTMSSYDAKGISCKVAEATTTTKPVVTQLVTTTTATLPSVSGTQKAVMASKAEVTESTTIAVTEPSTEAVAEVVTTEPVTEPSQPVIEATEPITEPVTAIN